MKKAVRQTKIEIARSVTLIENNERVETFIERSIIKTFCQMKVKFLEAIN